MKFSQVINVLQTLLSGLLVALPVMLLNLGCVQDAAGGLDCTNAMIAPKTLGYIAAAIGFLKLVVLPAISPGGWFANLFGARAAVVSPTSTGAQPAGTVTPSDIKQ